MFNISSGGTVLQHLSRITTGIQMQNLRSSLMLLKAIFWVTLVFTVVEATVSPEHALRIFAWDKAEHFSAFYALTILALLAFPTWNWIAIGLALAALGGMIELVQALPIVGRDCDIRDWAADLIAICAVLFPLAALRWRDFHLESGDDISTAYRR
jgi:hypothetical protein